MLRSFTDRTDVGEKMKRSAWVGMGLSFLVTLGCTEDPPDVDAGLSDAGTDAAVSICTSSDECTDGVFCNGPETCEVAFSQCLDGSPPCTTYEGYSAPCDEASQSCPTPDPCFTWIGGAKSGFFFHHGTLTGLSGMLPFQ